MSTQLELSNIGRIRELRKRVSLNQTQLKVKEVKRDSAKNISTYPEARQRTSVPGPGFRPSEEQSDPRPHRQSTGPGNKFQLLQVQTSAMQYDEPSNTVVPSYFHLLCPSTVSIKRQKKPPQYLHDLIHSVSVIAGREVNVPDVEIVVVHVRVALLVVVAQLETRKESINSICDYTIEPQTTHVACTHTKV